MAVFSVDGHFLDDDSSINGYLITDMSDVPDGFAEEDIFFFGVGEQNLIGEHDDFVVTSYTKVAE